MPSIRIVVKIPEGVYPDLIADLANVQLRDRAERLRVLAMLGLRESVRNTQNQFEAVPTPDARAQSANTKIIQRLADNL